MRRGLLLLEETTERESLREAYRRPSSATRGMLADLGPQRGAEPKKVRPVVVVQNDLLNETGHPSTWILPCTTRLTGESLLSVVLPRGIAGNRRDCEVMNDQCRAIDNRRFVRTLKPIPSVSLREVETNLRLAAGL